MRWTDVQAIEFNVLSQCASTAFLKLWLSRLPFELKLVVNMHDRCVVGPLEHDGGSIDQLGNLFLFV